MPTDTGQIVSGLIDFYDFAGKTVVDVGAGGGQLAEFARKSRRVIAVDHDEVALERLARRLEASGLAGRFTLVAGEFLEVRDAGDVVLLEFSLHQMPEPERALEHASRLAPDVLVVDHAPSSIWSWYAAEERQVAAGWKAVEARTVRRWRAVEAFQSFRDHAELETRLASQPPKSAERLRALRGHTSISIPMPYWMALI